MDHNKLFKGLGGVDVSIFERIKTYAGEVDIGPLLSSLFEEDTSPHLAATHVEELSRLLVSAGTLLAIVRSSKAKLENKLNGLYMNEYIKVTDELLKPGARGSSKYDVTYRGGMARKAEKYKEISELIREVSELEGRISTFKEMLTLRSSTLPAILKLERSNSY